MIKGLIKTLKHSVSNNGVYELIVGKGMADGFHFFLDSSETPDYNIDYEKLPLRFGFFGDAFGLIVAALSLIVTIPRGPKAALISVRNIGIYSISLVLRFALLVGAVVFLSKLGHSKLLDLPFGQKIQASPQLTRGLQLMAFFIIGIYAAVLLSKIFICPRDQSCAKFDRGNSYYDRKTYEPSFPSPGVKGHIGTIIFATITSIIALITTFLVINNYIGLDFAKNPVVGKFFEFHPICPPVIVLILGLAFMFTILQVARIEHNKAHSTSITINDNPFTSPFDLLEEISNNQKIFILHDIVGAFFSKTVNRNYESV